MYLDPDGSSSSNGGLIHKSGNGNFGWAIYLDSFTSGKYKFRFSQRWDNEDLIQEAHEVYPGIWNHIVVTYNANSKDNRATFYLDARVRTFDVLSSSYDASDSTAITTDAAQDLEVGRKNTSGTYQEQYFDNFVIFNREITSSEVATIYSAYKNSHLIEDGHFPSNDMLLYHTFNAERRESDGKPTDQSGNGNHATLSGTAIKGGYHADVTGLSTDTNSICEEFISESPASTSDLRIDGNGMELNKDHEKEHGVYFFGNGDAEGPYMQLNNEISLDKNYTISFWAKDDWTFGGSRILGGSSNSVIKTGGYDHIYF